MQVVLALTRLEKGTTASSLLVTMLSIMPWQIAKTLEYVVFVDKLPTFRSHS